MPTFYMDIIIIENVIHTNEFIYHKGISRKKKMYRKDFVLNLHKII